MKFKKGALLIPAMMFALMACNNTQTNSTGGVLNSNTSDSSSDSSLPSVLEVAKKYAITLSAAEGTEINLVTEADADGKYEAGAPVKFTVEVEPSVALKKVTANGKEVFASSDGYEFTMQNENVTLATEVISLGSSDVITVSDVDEEHLPQSAADVKELLIASKEKEKIYLKSATYDSTFDSSSYTYHYDGEVGVNQVAKVYEYKYGTTDKLSLFTINEYGFYGEDKFYNFKESKSSSSSQDYATQGTMQKIVSNDVEETASNEIKRADAETNVATVGFVDKLLEKTFSNNTGSFLNTSENDGWNFIEVSNNVDNSKKFYTVTMNARYKSTYYRHVLNLSIVVDGDSFVKSVDFTQKEYSSDDWNSSEYKPQDGAEPTSTKYIRISQERNYRQVLDKKNLSNYVMHDYDVEFSYLFPEISTYTTYDVDENKKVANSSQLSFKFRQKDHNPIVFTPMVVGSEEEGFIEFDEKGEPRIAKEGSFHVVFDNGIGELKEFELNSITPDPVKINASFEGGNSIFNGESKLLKVEVLPTASSQSATVTLDETSVAEVEITDNQDGTFSIKGTKDGSGKLNIASAINGSITTSVDFTVKTKPNVQNVRTFLTSSTLVGSVSSLGKHFVNFKDDGTGEYVCYENGKGDVLTFKWTFDEDAISLDVTWDDPDAKSKGYTPSHFDNLEESSIDFHFLYFGSEKGPANLVASSKKLDLTSASAEILKDYK